MSNYFSICFHSPIFSNMVVLFKRKYHEKSDLFNLNFDFTCNILSFYEYIL